MHNVKVTNWKADELLQSQNHHNTMAVKKQDTANPHLKYSSFTGAEMLGFCCNFKMGIFDFFFLNIRPDSLSM